MNISEKMSKLLGKKIVLNLILDEEKEIVGTLKEAGDDYLIIKPTNGKEEELINLKYVFLISRYDSCKLSKTKNK